MAVVETGRVLPRQQMHQRAPQRVDVGLGSVRSGHFRRAIQVRHHMVGVQRGKVDLGRGRGR